jgi:NADPH2:quinone reductase
MTIRPMRPHARDRAQARRPGDGNVGHRPFPEGSAIPARPVTQIPDGVPEPAAAAFGVAHRTAYHVRRSVAGMRVDERLILLGAGGGVGLAAVQLGATLPP